MAVKVNPKIAASLVTYINQLHKGNTDIEMFEYHRCALEKCSAAEVNLAIDNLIARYKAVDELEITVSRFIRACGKSLDKQNIKLPETGIFRILITENRKIEKQLGSLKAVYKEFLAGIKKDINNPDQSVKQKLLQELMELKTVRIHYLKLQYGVFSALEKYGDNISCFKLMWFIQDSVMDNLKNLSGQLERPEEFGYERFNRLFGEMYFRISYLFYREEKILFPLAVKIIPDSVQEKLISEAESYGVI